jgi:hypothetical protein
MRGLNRDLLNELNPRDLPRNHRTGLEGEVVWTRYLNSIGVKAVQAKKRLFPVPASSHVQAIDPPDQRSSNIAVE